MINLGIVKVKLEQDPFQNNRVKAEVYSMENEPEDLDSPSSNFPTSFSSIDASAALHGLKMRLKQKSYTGTIRVID